MKIPKTIMLGGHDISVEQVTTEVLTSKGDFDSWRQRIRVNVDDTTESGQAETLLHEILEAVDYYGQYELSHPVLSGISTMLFAAIRQNKLTFLKD